VQPITTSIAADERDDAAAATAMRAVHEEIEIGCDEATRDRIER